MPLSQPILKNAEVTDTTLRNTIEFTQIEYFMDRFPKIIPEGANKQDIQQEFAAYKALPDERIPPHILRNIPHKTWERIYEERGDQRWVALSKRVDKTEELCLTHLPS